MTQHVFANRQVPHVWAAQSQREGRSHSGNFYFRGRTIYSYRDSWPLGTFLPSDWLTPEGKRIVVLNREHYSRTTTARASDTWLALDSHIEVMRSHDVRTVRQFAHDVNDNTYSDDNHEARHKAAIALIEERIKRLRDYATKCANLRGRLFPPGEEDSEAIRLESLSPLINDITECARLLGVLREYIPAYDLDAMREAIRSAYAKYNDPKRAKARASAQRRASIIKLERWRSGASYRVSDDDIAAAFQRHPERAKVAFDRMAFAYLQRDIKASFTALNPDADAIEWARRHADPRFSTSISPDEWRNRANGRIRTEANQTLVRKRGNILETSHGAEVPWRDAVAVYRFAHRCKMLGQEWRRSGETFRVGAFQLDRVDTEGNITAGCHTIAFEEMERLAVREVPELVTARFPLPTLIRESRSHGTL